MVWHKSVIYLPLSLHEQVVHLCEEVITIWPKVEKAVQHAPLSPTFSNVIYHFGFALVVHHILECTFSIYHI